MVCDAALVMNLVSSVMMNGVCCISSMGEEERRNKEQKKMIRKAINVEWQRLKLMEFEHKQRIMREQGMDQGNVLAEERRRFLIATKQRASEQSSAATSRASIASESSRHPILEDMLENDEFDAVSARRADNHVNITSKKTAVYEFLDTECLQKRRRSGARSSSAESAGGEVTPRRVPLIIGVPSFLRSDSYSSLLDDDSDTDDEFDEIQLH
mmetsp:Transcript_29706/g.45296  ORF Transcript_29706/g.45296 Transcript_29706/m.45296 type:complete len:212 (+) Transcript_29706:185-820(+)